ncbi:MAG TPA: hypothetical protein VK666_29755 [Chryseolinea sp.]|nr:hypothetical protein [Chryseolinea sp.]
MEKIPSQNHSPKGLTEIFQTLRTDGKHGETMPKHAYDFWSHFMLSTLASSDLTLNELLEKAHQKKLPSADTKNDSQTGWYILQVKRDLEARGLIKLIAAPTQRHGFLIQLTRQGLSKVSYDQQVSAWSESDF